MCGVPIQQKPRGRTRQFCGECRKAKNRIRAFESRQDHTSSIRVKVINLLGGSCVDCGATENLEISHDNQDGQLDRAMWGGTRMGFYLAVKGGRREAADLSVRCHRCHLIYDHRATDEACAYGHPYPENLYKSPGGKSGCRICRSESTQRYRLKKKGLLEGQLF